MPPNVTHTVLLSLAAPLSYHVPLQTLDGVRERKTAHMEDNREVSIGDLAGNLAPSPSGHA